MSATVFISHSSRDAALAHDLVAALEAGGVACWISGRDVAPGANYQEAIVGAITGARAMVLLLTEAANASDEVKKELSLASAQGIAVYPVRIGRVQPNAALRYELATRQWIEGGDVPVLAARLAAAIGGFAATPAASEQAPEIAVAGKPSIAVLAFANMSGDPDQEYFSDGMAEDVITQLSHSNMLLVIARDSSFTYKSPAVDVKQIGHELGVRYVLQGSVRRAGERVRISAQLVEAATGTQIWADRYDRTLNDIFAVQDEISGAVARTIEPAITHAEQQRISRQPPDSLGAWEAYQRGLWHLGKSNAADAVQAQAFLAQAIRLDPSFAAAHAELAWVLHLDATMYGTRPLDQAVRLATEHAQAALAIDPRDATAHAAMCVLQVLVGDHDMCDRHADLALSLNPNHVRAMHFKAANLMLTGHPAAARVDMEAVTRLNPRDPIGAIYKYQVAQCHYLERDYAAAADAAQLVVAEAPGYPTTYRWLAAALGQLGRRPEAEAALRKAIEISPGSFRFYTASRPAWFRPEDYEHMLDGLRKAGWRE